MHLPKIASFCSKDQSFLYNRWAELKCAFLLIVTHRKLEVEFNVRG
jgi:hypothetical protein